jgi:hypothetical protein
MGAITRGTRLLAGAVAMTAVIAACGTGGAGGGVGAAASCAATLKFRRQVYGGTSLRTRPPYTRVGRIPASHRREIGEGILPPCHDTNHSHDVAQPVRVARITGVSPKSAVAVLPSGSVFVRLGARIPSALRSARWIHWVESN